MSVVDYLTGSSVLKKWFICLLAVWSCIANAKGPELAFESHSAPAWPKTLYDQGVSGWTLLQFNAHNDGSITDVDILESSHPQFSRSALKALPSWRLVPWIVTADKPDVLQVTQEIYFVHRREEIDPIAWLRRRIRHMSCASFNKALDAFNTSPNGLPVTDMSAFRHTFTVLARLATHQKLSDDQRAALGDSLTNGIPETISQCRSNPGLRYRDVLPELVRAIL
jgi:TonB family protein